MIYYVETNHAIYWSERKMDVQYKHCEFSRRDRAKFRELTKARFDRLSKTVEKKICQL